MSARWFRFYDEVVDDPKVQTLPCEVFRAWVNILCIASKNDGVLPSFAKIAFHLRCDETMVERIVDRLLNDGLIDRRNGGVNGYHYAPHGWDKRQYKSDTSTDRVKRFRQRKGETAPETETESEDNTNVLSGNGKKTQKPKQAPKPKAGKASLHLLPDDWEASEFGKGTKSQNIIDGWPDGQREFQLERFRGHHRAKGTKMTDWQSAWSTWVLNTVAFERTGNGRGNRQTDGFDEGRQSFNPMVEAYAEERARRPSEQPELYE